MPGSIQSIERAAAIVRLLAAAPAPLRLTEISAAVQLSRGTAHGILRTMVDVGWIEQDRATGKYLIGEGMFARSGAQIDPNELRARSMNWADPLAARSGEAVRVAVPERTGARVVHYVFRPDHCAQQADVGALLPGHASALGKVLLAFHPAVARTLTDQELTPYTSRTLSSRTRLNAELARVRRQGWAVERGEQQMELAALAAPLTGMGGLVVGAVGIHGEADRICDPGGVPRPRLLALVQECARAIDRELHTPRAQA